MLSWRRLVTECPEVRGGARATHPPSDGRGQTPDNGIVPWAETYTGREPGEMRWNIRRIVGFIWGIKAKTDQVLALWVGVGPKDMDSFGLGLDNITNIQSFLRKTIRSWWWQSALFMGGHYSDLASRPCLRLSDKESLSAKKTFEENISHSSLNWVLTFVYVWLRPHLCINKPPSGRDTW